MEKLFEQSPQEFILADKALRELGQMQYVMRPLTNIFPDEYPNLGDGIRYSGKYDNYYDIKIHKDDVVEYAERYIDWKNKTSAFPMNKIEIIEKIKLKL